MSTLTAPEGYLVLEDGTEYRGLSFGFPRSSAGEVVFNTGMVGYPESLTDPSYFGHILVFTFPLIGNYGVPEDTVLDNLSKRFESDKVNVSGLIVSDYSENYSHWNAAKSLSQWLNEHQVPALCGIDTRALTKNLRTKGTMLGKLVLNNDDIDFYDPYSENLAGKVSLSQPILYGSGGRRICVVDCGCKHNIIRSLLKRGCEVLRVPWNYDFTHAEQFDGVIISNGPGDPQTCPPTIQNIRQMYSRDIPVFGICLGNQLMALAAGASTYKLKYGHRSQNQPVIEAGTNRCLVTSQNHGFAVDSNSLPSDWKPWFVNLNDQTNEGIKHISGRFFSVQFHPEASPGPVDADYLFDEFLKVVWG